MPDCITSMIVYIKTGTVKEEIKGYAVTTARSREHRAVSIDITDLNRKLK